MANIKTSKTLRAPSTHTEQGKGNWKRKRMVSDREYDRNWERIFGARKTDKRVRKS